MPLKNPVELLSARKAAGSRPATCARASVVSSTKAPAGSSGLAAAAVGAVGIGGKAGEPRRAAEMDGERQCIFLVRAALALAAQRHGQFAAGEDDGAAALGAHRQRQPGVLGRDLARLALQAAAKHDAFIAGRLARAAAAASASAGRATIR